MISYNNPDAFKSYETAPGEQMQFDWAHYTVSIAGELVKIYIYQTILVYSRYKFYDVSLSITQSDVLNALEESFMLFGGVCERIQVDNAKVFIDNASRNLTWNKLFMHFCGFYGIKPTRSTDIKISMDGVGRATDNIAIQRFWRSIKYKEIYLNEYKNMKVLHAAIDKYINTYNKKRSHSAIDYQTPDEVYYQAINDLGEKGERLLPKVS